MHVPGARKPTRLRQSDNSKYCLCISVEKKQVVGQWLRVKSRISVDSEEELATEPEMKKKTLKYLKNL